ncbi:Unknown protein sequence [Pseudomonas syringae pv. castaneae]|uniref:Uncharacterized protein n=1 Tax=Pseudomonas syringae pv. castaneae TaxID=264450 RepID=A0A0N8R385_PSESX|nr:Unknown protein sequence [Pseudomonas syringae pv. castaneae]
MHLPGDIIQLDQITVAHRPEIDGFFQITEMTEIQIEPDHAGHIVRVVSPLEDTRPRRFQVRWLTIQCHPQVMPALGHGYGLLVFAENRLITAVGVEIEVVDGVFLPLGPEAFPRYIAANCRQHVETDAPE